MKHIYLVFLLFSVSLGFGQCLSSGALPTVVRGFGAGVPQYSTQTTTGFGFSTTYKQVFGTRTGVQKDWIVDGEFAIINLTADPFYSFGNKPVWHKDVSDHTGDPGGYMMAFNASIDPGEFYREEVSGLCTGVTYDFSVWIANLDVPEPSRTKPNVRFEIRNAYDNSLIADYETGEIAQNATLQWEQHAVTFNANVDRVTLLLINNNPGGAGNDLLIDDIEFKPCLPVYTAVPSIATELCVGDDLTLEAKDDGVGYFTPEFQWQRKDNSTGNWLDLTGETNPILNLNNVSEVDSGWYKVFVAEKGVLSSIQCRSEDSFFVDIQPTLLPGKIESNQQICYNSLPMPLVSLTPASGAQGLFNYFWEASTDSITWNDLTNTNDNYSPNNLTQSTVFRRGVKSSCYTEYSDTVIVEVYASMDGGEIESAQIVCADSLPLELINKIAPRGGEINYTYEWEYSTDQSTWNVIANSNNLNYTPTAITEDTWFRRKTTDNSCGTVFSNEIKLTYQLTAPPVVSDEAICQGVSFPGFSVSGSNLLWYESINDVSGESIFPKVDSSVSGMESYFVTTTENGCESAKAEIKVTIYNTPEVTVNNLVFCAGEEGDLITNVTGGTLPYSYSWTPVIGLSSTNTSQVTAKPTVTTEYTVIVKDQKQCADTALAQVTVHSNPDVKITGGDICSGTPTTLEAVVTNATGLVKYNWSPSTGLSSTSVSKILANPASTTSYKVVVEDLNSCKDSASFTVGVTTTPTASIITRDTVLCVGEQYALEAYDDPSQDYSFQWLYGTSPASLSPISETNSIAVIENEGYYAVEVRNNSFCPEYSNVVMILVEEVDVHATASDTEIKYGEEVELSAKSTGNVQDWAWTTPNGIVKGENIIDKPEETFIYTVIASATKCSAKDEVEVTVLQPILIPNGFSPNGDGKNDFWVIESLDQYLKAEVVVFNRWGGKVFEKIGGYTQPWDGTSFNGGALPDATYYYVIQVNDSDGTIFKGSVTILR